MLQKLSFLGFILFLQINLFAQKDDSFIPDEFVLETAEDYAPYEDNIVGAIDYLSSNPIDDRDELRAAAEKMFLLWITGSPSVNVHINPYLIEIVEKNPAFLPLFMGGWTKYVIQNPDQKDNHLQGNLEGLEMVLDFYQKGKDFGVVKDKKVAKLLKIQKAGKLKEHIKDQIPQ